METNLFLIAAKQKLRFPSVRGELLTEQLWDLPLTATNGFSLDAVAKSINGSLRALNEESFVENTSSAEKTQLSAQLEIVKFVIADKQAAAKAAAERAAKRARRHKLLEALEAKDNAAIEGMSREDILKELEEQD
jgi:hypothetical protein